MARLSPTRVTFDSERTKLRRRLYDDDLYAKVRLILRKRFFKNSGGQNNNGCREDDSPPTVFGQIIKERDEILNDLKRRRAKRKYDSGKIDVAVSKLNIRKAVLEETKKEVIRAYARKNLMGIHGKLLKTFAKYFYTRFEIQNYVTWKVSFNNLKGPGYEPGTFIGMMVKRQLRGSGAIGYADTILSEETGLRHAALVAANIRARDHVLAPFKEIYMPKDTEYSSGAMLKMLTGVNRCAFALNNISHLREYDSAGLLFDAARKSGRSFETFCAELVNVSCLRPDSMAAASINIPVLRDVSNLFNLYNATGSADMGGMDTGCPNNILFVDLGSVHKSLVAECLLWRFVLKRRIGGDGLLNVYKSKYVNAIAPFNLCQEYPGIFGILTHFLYGKDERKFKGLIWALHTIHTTPKRLDRVNVDVAADIMIELMYRIDDAVAVLDNQNWLFEETKYIRYLTNGDNHFLLNNVLAV